MPAVIQKNDFSWLTIFPRQAIGIVYSGFPGTFGSLYAASPEARVLRIL